MPLWHIAKCVGKVGSCSSSGKVSWICARKAGDSETLGENDLALAFGTRWRDVWKIRCASNHLWSTSPKFLKWLLETVRPSFAFLKEKFMWMYVILDEAQRIKNGWVIPLQQSSPEEQRMHKSLHFYEKSLAWTGVTRWTLKKADSLRILLTGTPLQNNTHVCSFGFFAEVSCRNFGVF